MGNNNCLMCKKSSNKFNCPNSTNRQVIQCTRCEVLTEIYEVDVNYISRPCVSCGGRLEYILWPPTADRL